jgi:hypothetical protein
MPAGAGLDMSPAPRGFETDGLSRLVPGVPSSPQGPAICSLLDQVAIVVDDLARGFGARDVQGA